MSLKNPFETRRLIPSSNYSPFIFSSDGQSIVSNDLVTAGDVFKNSDLFAASTMITADMASADFVGDNKTLTKKLNNPNNYQNRYSFWQLVYLELLLSGNAFVVVNKTQSGVPQSFRFVPSQFITLDLTRDTLHYKINEYNDYSDAYLSSDDVLHFTINAHGSNGSELIGHSPLESLASELTTQSQAKRLARLALLRSINPTSIIKIPLTTLSPEAKNTIRSEFEKANSGENAGRPMVLDQSADFSKVSVNADVSKLLNSDTYGRNQIAKAFGIPSSMINGSNSDGQSSIEMIRAEYINNINRYIEAINAEIQLKLDTSINLDTSDIIDYSGQTYSKNLISYVDKGIVEPNEAKELLIKRGLL